MEAVEISCPKCGKPLTEYSERCPHCQALMIDVTERQPLTETVKQFLSDGQPSACDALNAICFILFRAGVTPLELTNLITDADAFARLRKVLEVLP